MPQTTLIVEGRAELVVRMALLLYLAETEKEKKKLSEKFGVATDEIEETIDTTKDVLQQLGWKPAGKGTAEVVRPEDIGQTDMFSGPRAGAELPPAEVFTVRCKCGTHVSGCRAPSTTQCPTCYATIALDMKGENLIVDVTPAAPLELDCLTCTQKFTAPRKNGAVACPHCDARHEVFLDDTGALVRLVPRPLPPTGG
jgi:hypothetical protein